MLRARLLDAPATFLFQNWLGYTKKRAPIGFHRVVEILHKNSAPVQVLASKERWGQDPLGDLTCSLLLVSDRRPDLFCSSLKGSIVAILGLEIGQARREVLPAP